MIVYFADRDMNILGMASTNLPDGYVILDDNKTQEVDTGVNTFTAVIGFTEETRIELQEMVEAGNYLLRANGEEKEFYTIIEETIDTKDQTIEIYAEDAGLDLINEVVGEYKATSAHIAQWYINKYIAGTGFEIGIDQLSDATTRTLSWDGSSTVTERLASIVNSFGNCEISYSFEIERLKVTHKYINIYDKRGDQDSGVQLRLNQDIDKIVTTRSVANLATALEVTGGTPENSKTPITLKGYQGSDADYYVSGTQLISKKGIAK